MDNLSPKFTLSKAFGKSSKAFSIVSLAPSNGFLLTASCKASISEARKAGASLS